MKRTEILKTSEGVVSVVMDDSENIASIGLVTGSGLTWEPISKNLYDLLVKELRNEDTNNDPNKEHEEVFVLMADVDGTTWSSDTPIGVAVTSEEEAKRYVEEGKVGYSHSYKKLVVFDNKDEAIRY